MYAMRYRILRRARCQLSFILFILPGRPKGKHFFIKIMIVIKT